MKRLLKLTKRVTTIVIISVFAFAIYTNFFKSKDIALVYHSEDSIDVNSYIRKLNGMNINFTPIDMNEEDLEENLKFLDNMDGVVFAGGKDFDPAIYGGGDTNLVEDYDFSEDRADIMYLSAAISKGIPILGICRGCQLINIYFGGSLYEDLPTQFSKEISHRNGKDKFAVHDIKILPETRLYNLIDNDTWSVNSFHHEGIKDLGEGLIVSAVAPDGLVEAIENPNYKYLMGIQWHPEATYDDHLSDIIFDDFINAVRR